MKFVSQVQLIESLRQLAAFRSRVNKQSAQHILPFLALRKKGVTTGTWTTYEEREDFGFFDEYMRVAGDPKPYFDPIGSMFRIAGHPHSNVATARKGTFFRSWHAAEQRTEGQADEWTLTGEYLAIFKKKLTKGKRLTRIPAIPLGVFLLREKGFPNQSSLADVATELRGTFGLTPLEFEELFETDTKPNGDFGNARLSNEEVVAAITESGVVTQVEEDRTTYQTLTIQNDDAILQRVKQLLADGYAGVIFVGPPGTSKSWYAVQIALALTEGNSERIRKVQFHRSFQYEQFVEGFAPNSDGTGFELRDQLMLRVIEEAQGNRAGTYVVLIDELSRSDPGRVFGELLTYMEPSRRDETFLLASGTETSVPPNIVFLATMNSRDKSVAEIDDAFDRRMAKIDFPPDVRIVEQLLSDNNVPEDFSRRIVGFFRWINTKYPLGHTFFLRVKDADGLKRLWDSQLKYIFEKHFRYEPQTVQEIRTKFTEITGVEVDT